MGGILFAGTSSDAGKSLVVTGVCRALARRGLRVAPFKAQNMSNNSAVCADGSEIGRAQYLQAQAAGVEPSSLLNPVLLKPGSDRRSFVVLRGRPAGTLEAGEYATGRAALAESAFAAYRELAASYDLVIAEGAGSPAEINLRRGDYVNMGLARQFYLPVVVVGDIDRGGVLASLYGTWALLGEADRALLGGYVINKFRGDASILEPGLADLTARTGLPCFGVLPWLPDVWLDGEDTLAVGRWAGRQDSDAARLTVAVVRFPRLSNATDVDALAGTPGVEVAVTDDPAVVASADLAVLPGTRSTVDDLAWLRARSIDRAVVERHAAGRPVVGICGGYEMLGRRIVDEVESGAGEVAGIGVLPVDVTFGAKVTRRAAYPWRGRQVAGYEIHHGVCTPYEPAEEFLDGVRVGATAGTMLHGAFEDDAFRLGFLAEVADAVGSDWRATPGAPGYAAQREQMVDTLADAMEEHLDLDALVALARGGSHPAPDTPPPTFHPTPDTPRPGPHPTPDNPHPPSHPTPDTPRHARNAATRSQHAACRRVSSVSRGEPGVLDEPGVLEEPGDVGEPGDAEGAGRGPVVGTASTTRERRLRPRLIVHTGDGKGKSTAAFGLGLRAWAQGWSIGVYQFVKSGKWRSGEQAAYASLAELRDAEGGAPVEWHTMGSGWTWLRATADIDQAELARAGWQRVAEQLANQTHRLYILDEFTYPLARGWVDLDDVLATLQARPGDQHVVITGRGAPAALVAAADLVTHFDKVKHPFDRGERGRAGIEW